MKEILSMIFVFIASVAVIKLLSIFLLKGNSINSDSKNNTSIDNFFMNSPSDDSWNECDCNDSWGDCDSGCDCDSGGDCGGDCGCD
ncbi:hypothetical protein FHH43_10095 [Clostridium perfringens]|nr:hypothetical protein [Clostridium perfringens]